jgi:dTMP kinase
MFVVFEGIDGSGKTTVSNQVASRLQARGLSVTHLRAGGRFASVVSESIRELGRDARNLELVPEAEFLLYVARDVQLIEEVLRPALRASDVILADRFLYTAEVLGRYGRRLSAEWTAPILRAAAGGIVPDLVVLVDVDPVLARARRKSAKLAAADQRPPARKGLAGVGLQHRLRRGYLELASAAPERWAVVDNDTALDELVARVTELIAEASRVGVPTALASFRGGAGGRAGRGAAAGRPLRSPEDALAAFLSWLDRRAEREPRVAAQVLAGLAGPGVDDRRRELAGRVPEAVLAGLEGLTDPVSWELRAMLSGEHGRAVARTLIGISNEDPRAAELRQALEQEASLEVAASLARLDDEPAWRARGRLYEAQPDAVASSLALLGSPRAWQLRQRWLDSKRPDLASSYAAAVTGAKSVTGLDDEESWRIREEAYPAAPVAALASIEGLAGPQSWRWREEYLGRAPKVVMNTMRGLRDARAWQMRETVAADCKEALDSIIGLDDPEAWALREAHADTWPSTVVKTLGPLALGARGRALIERQLAGHPANVSLLKHAAAIALGAQNHTSNIPD